jgi:hypothetical protein
MYAAPNQVIKHAGRNYYVRNVPQWALDIFRRERNRRSSQQKNRRTKNPLTHLVLPT